MYIVNSFSLFKVILPSTLLFFSTLKKSLLDFVYKGDVPIEYGLVTTGSTFENYPLRIELTSFAQVPLAFL